MVSIQTLVYARWVALGASIVAVVVLIIGDRSGFSRSASITTGIFYGIFSLTWVGLLIYTYRKSLQMQAAATAAIARSEQGLPQGGGPPTTRSGGDKFASQTPAQVSVGGNAPPSYSESVQAYSHAVHGVHGVPTGAAMQGQVGKESKARPGKM